jgi:hypothetical protein
MPLSSFISNTSNNAPKELILTLFKKWHTIMRHLGQEPLSHLKANTTKAIIITSSSLASSCETCIINKAYEIVSHYMIKNNPMKEPITRVAYDLV